MNNILICDDDPDILSALKIYLSGEYNIFEAADGRTAVEIAEKDDIHLVLMDIMMPVLDGISATAKLREKHNLPIILITAKSEDSDKALGLDIGADDYITKPFSPIEVRARVRSQLRRYLNLGGASERAASADGVLRVGAIELDDDAKTVTADGEPIALTPLEFDILKLLMQNPGKVFSTAEIYRLVWNESPVGSETAVAVHIRHVREKIEIEPSNPRYLKVMWGRGYKIEGGEKYE